MFLLFHKVVKLVSYSVMIVELEAREKKCEGER
jgi:hypothetical protein